MKPIRLLVGFLLVAIAPCASAQDASAIWKTLSEPAFDPAKSARVENIELQRDRVHITLKDGMIEFTQPVNGIVFGAAFQGHAALDVDPPNALEAQQLERFTHEEKLHIEFSDATFTFTDSTFDDVAKEVKWLPSPPRSLAGLYQSRQNSREDVGAEVLPRLFQSILSSNRERTAFFFADMKTDDAGWIQVREDALDLEEVFVGRLSNWIGFTAFDTWAHFPAGGRSPVLANEEPLAKDDYEVDGYTLDNHIGGNAELAATATVRLALRASGEQVLRFSLDSNLRVDSVKDGDGRALSYFQPPPRKDGNQSHGDYVAVALTAPTEAGKPLTLLFHYQGKYVIYKVGPGNFYCRSSNWYPTAPNPFATRSNFEMTFEIPKKFILIATGDKVTDTIDGGSNITAWKSSIPLAVAGFAYGDYKLVTQAAGDVAINVYANRSPDELLSSIQTTVDVNSPIDINNPLAGAMPAMGNLNASNLAKSMGSELANTVRLFQTYFGAYPYKSLSATNILAGYGQGWPSLLYLSVLSFLDSTQRNALGIHDQLELTDAFRAHEASHQWWGQKVGWKSYHDQWLSEGFAEFSGMLYVQFRENWGEYLRRLRIERQNLKLPDRSNRPAESLGPIWMGFRIESSDSRGLYQASIYSKGAYVLNMIRMMLFDQRAPDPDAQFKAMMQDFTQTYDNKAASTEDFKAIVEKHMVPAMDLEGNHRMSWFFRQYVYGTGIPQYSFSYTLADAGNGQWKVTGNLTRLGGPERWMDILPIYAHTGGKLGRLGWLTVRQRMTPVEFTLPFRPDKLVLNENDDILADIQQR